MKTIAFGVAFGAWVFIIQQLGFYVWCGTIIAAALVLWRYRK